MLIAVARKLLEKRCLGFLLNFDLRSLLQTFLNVTCLLDFCGVSPRPIIPRKESCSTTTHMISYVNQINLGVSMSHQLGQ